MIHMQTHRLMGGFMEYVAEMGSRTMMHIPSFIKIGSDFKELIKSIHGHYSDLVSRILFLSNYGK
jgi:hypothetical protein